MSLRQWFKGLVGETQTELTQRLLLDSEQYHFFHDILIPDDQGSTQIDHVIVSKYGVFVVETKRRDGWIYGTESDEKWRWVFFNKKGSFQNPLRQNYRHTKSLAKYLQINHDKIHSLVVFWGKCEFKTQMPERVVKGFLNYKNYIKSKNRILLTDDEVKRICDQLQSLKDQTSFLDGFRHAYSLKKRYEDSTVCPKCGGNLLERTARKGRGTGGKFLGCENYPRCRYTKELK